MRYGLQQASDARVLYIDFNSYFASCEQQRSKRPLHQPLAVVSHHGSTGTVLSASYSAKALGIRTGTKVRDALSLCPQIILSETDPALYKNIHARFVEIVQRICGPLAVQVRSIDELSVRLSASEQNSATASSIARTVKETFAKEIGDLVLCSIGIAPNVLLAKLATDLQKPNGLVEITLANTQAILSTLTLTDLPGIAERTQSSLVAAGITTPLALYNADPALLRARFGIWGNYWWWRLHGFEPDTAQGAEQKMMSHEHVLKQWLYRTAATQPVASKMTDRLIHRLRRNRLHCQSVSVYLGIKGQSGFWAERRFDAPTGSYPLLLSSVQNLISSFPPLPPGGIRKINLTLGGLTEAFQGVQQDIFDQHIRQEKISRALEHIRQRFGFDGITLASSMLTASQAAKEELGFGRLKDRALIEHSSP